MATRNTTEEVGEKEQTTNEQYGLRSTQSARRASLWHWIPCASVDYRWRAVLTKLLQATENVNSSLTAFLTADRCRLRTANSSCLSSSVPLDSISRQLESSAVCCWLPLWVTLRQLPSLGSFFQLASLAFLCPLPSLAFPCPLPWLLSDLAPPTSGLIGDLDSKPFVWLRAMTDKMIFCLADHHIVSEI